MCRGTNTRSVDTLLTRKQARFDPKQARRRRLLRETSTIRHRIVRYAVRPFDARWCYYTGVRPVWNEPRPTLQAAVFAGECVLHDAARPA